MRSSFIHSAASETRRRAHFAVGPRQHEVSDRSTGAGRPDARSISSDGGLRYTTATGRWVVAATVLGSCMASIDATVVGIALPTIGHDFHAPIGTLQWVVTGYSLTLGAFLLLGGSLGDHYGRRKIYLIGVTWFAASSAACALTPGTTPLIAAAGYFRALERPS